MDDSLLPVTSLRENLTQTHLDFSYFRTTEPKLTPALRKMPLTDLRHTIWTGDAYHPQTIICRGDCRMLSWRNSMEKHLTKTGIFDIIITVMITIIV